MSFASLAEWKRGKDHVHWALFYTSAQSCLCNTDTPVFWNILGEGRGIINPPPPDSSIQHSRASSSHCGAGLSVMKWGLLATQRGKSLPGFSGPLGSALDLFLYIHWVMPLAGLQILPKTANNRTPDIPGVSKHSSRWFQDRPSPQS